MTAFSERTGARGISIGWRAGLLAALLAIPTAGWAAWSSNPAQNFAVADRSGEQVIPKIASTPDGGCYIGWFDNTSTGNYDVYLQRLDADGNEQWPHNGLLVSSHTSDTSLVDWDMLADSSGNAVLVFADVRAGGDLDIYAYRISPGGAFLWGPDGVTLSANEEFEPAPVVAETSDGNFVFVWAKLPNAGVGSLMIQKLDPSGAPQFGPSGISIVGGAPSERPAFCDVVAADAGGFIVSWVRDIRTFTSPRHVRAQKFSSAGAPLWGAGPLIVYDAASVPIAHLPVLRSDGSGGAVLAWHVSVSNLFSTFVQHVSAGGVEVFPHNGIEVSTTPSRHKLDPTLSYQAATGDILVFWNERNPNQDMWGISGQKISPAGARKWGNGGAVLQPVDSVDKELPRSVPFADGALVFFLDHPTFAAIDARVVAMRVDADGHVAWPLTPVCSVLSGKTHYAVESAGGEAYLAWEDDRTDPADVYAQNITGAAGALGLVPPREVSAPGAAQPLVFTNPTTLRWEAAALSDSRSFNLYRDPLTALPGGDGVCLQPDLGASTATDAAVPATGAGYFYLVTGENTRGEGPMGVSSSGVPRTPDSVCP